MSNTSPVKELHSFGGLLLGGKLSFSESDFTGSEFSLLLNACLLQEVLLFGGVAWSSGAPADGFFVFSMDSMVELIWPMADDMSASTLSVPWCEEFADSFYSESRFSSSASDRGSLPLKFLAFMLRFSRCSLNTESETTNIGPSRRITHH